MKDLACIAIGINQYQFLQPLSYAQQDAEALYTLLIEEAGFVPEKSLLCTENSPPRHDLPTYPTRDNILNLIESLCQKEIQGGKGLWFFFSGYGFSYKGEDYLMPIEGLMSEVEATGISVRSLIDKLKTAPTNFVLLLLDINRSKNATTDDPIGMNTIQLAREMEVPIVLSCNPGEVARETSALRHGFFTAALLEGLHSGDCTTLKSLENFLSYHLPELCDRHLRPKQNPLIVVNPPDKIEEVILASREQLDGVVLVSKASELGLIPSNKIIRSQNLSDQSRISESNHLVPEAKGGGENIDRNEIRFQTNNLPNLGEQTMSQNTTQPIKSDKSFLNKLILSSFGVAVVLLLGVIVTNKSVLLDRQAEVRNDLETGSRPMPLVSEQDNSAFEVVPQAVSSSAMRPEDNLSADSQILLEQARVSLGGISASRLSEAIAKASQIQRNDPLYSTAQQDIERWSQTILDIANGRALQGNYQTAIASAGLVPDFVRPVYQEAQQAIEEWDKLAQQLQTNQVLLTAAKAMIEPGQASSYNKAIDKAKEVNPELPGYEEARILIANWSNTIFNIAQLRAERGNFSEAIRAAELVPPTTPAYDKAQKAIADWKIQQRTQDKT